MQIFDHVVANCQMKHDTTTCGFKVLVASCKDGCCLACGTGSVAKGEKRILYNPGAVHLVPVLSSMFFQQERY